MPSSSASPPHVPTGTVTFAFTDIEGSTVRWDRHPQAMADAVKRHDALVRTAIEAHHGHVFKTLGDAFCCAFARPHDAVAAMLDAQRLMADEDFTAVGGLRVRAAVHTGTADERDGDYFGPTVNRVAWLLSIGHGGQILISGVTSDLVQGQLPPRSSLRDLGEHRLKDLARPEYVYGLVAPGLSADFPPLRPNNLPLQRTSFIGRETEIAEITNLLASHRLVTLVGTGGVGKTRASLQVGANVLDGMRDGVWFIELAPLTSGEFIASTIAAAMGIAVRSNDPLTDVIAVLVNKHALLIVDNCEHVVDAAAHTIAAIVAAAPNVSVLASTRQALGIAGEATYRMPSLPVGTVGPAPRCGDALAFAAVALFVERARGGQSLRARR